MIELMSFFPPGITESNQKWWKFRGFSPGFSHRFDSFMDSQKKTYLWISNHFRHIKWRNPQLFFSNFGCPAGDVREVFPTPKIAEGNLIRFRNPCHFGFATFNRGSQKLRRCELQSPWGDDDAEIEQMFRKGWKTPVNQDRHGKWTLDWRCISYWKWGIFQPAMLVYQRVQVVVAKRDRFFPYCCRLHYPSVWLWWLLMLGGFAI